MLRFLKLGIHLEEIVLGAHQRLPELLPEQLRSRQVGFHLIGRVLDDFSNLPQSSQLCLQRLYVRSIIVHLGLQLILHAIRGQLSHTSKIPRMLVINRLHSLYTNRS